MASMYEGEAAWQWMAKQLDIFNPHPSEDFKPNMVNQAYDNNHKFNSHFSSTSTINKNIPSSEITGNGVSSNLINSDNNTVKSNPLLEIFKYNKHPEYRSIGLEKDTYRNSGRRHDQINNFNDNIAMNSSHTGNYNEKDGLNDSLNYLQTQEPAYFSYGRESWRKPILPPTRFGSRGRQTYLPKTNSPTQRDYSTSNTQHIKHGSDTMYGNDISTNISTGQPIQINDEISGFAFDRGYESNNLSSLSRPPRYKNANSHLSQLNYDMKNNHPTNNYSPTARRNYLGNLSSESYDGLNNLNDNVNHRPVMRNNINNNALGSSGTVNIHSEIPNGRSSLLRDSLTRPSDVPMNDRRLDPTSSNSKLSMLLSSTQKELETLRRSSKRKDLEILEDSTLISLKDSEIAEAKSYVNLLESENIRLKGEIANLNISVKANEATIWQLKKETTLLRSNALKLENKMIAVPATRSSSKMGPLTPTARNGDESTLLLQRKIKQLEASLNNAKRREEDLKIQLQTMINDENGYYRNEFSSPASAPNAYELKASP